MPGFFSSAQMTTIASNVPEVLPQCGKCGLSKKCLSPKMEWTGDGTRKILFVAEAPGEEEDKRGVQLVGEAGQILRRSLDKLGIDLDDCWKTNAVICRPPKNKIEPYMISCCRPTLLKTIKKLQPNVIVILGSSALQSLLYKEWKKDYGPLKRWLGWTIPSRQYKAWLCPTYHPSYLLRTGEQPVMVREFEGHLRQALGKEHTKVETPSLPQLQKQVEIIKTTKAAKLRLKDLSKKTGIVAFDYETTGLKPEANWHEIVSVSFCFKGEDTFAFSMRPELMSAVSKVLRNPKLAKVASNLKYEERWTRHFFGHGVRNWHWDTMLAAHILNNTKGICSVKFQAYVLLGIPDYDSHISPFLKSKTANGKNNIHQIDTNDLLMYNGLDSLLEYQVMKKQVRIYAAALRQTGV